MAWKFRSLDSAFERWAADKDLQETLELLQRLAILIDHPMSELPGRPQPGRLPTRRWEDLGQAYVFFVVFEAQGVLSVTDLVNKKRDE